MASPDRKELQAQWKTEVEVKTYKPADVAKHNTKNDVWITIHGKVYDVTSYLRDHPGGAEALLEVAGQDGTSGYEDTGHSEDAREIMHTFLVGVIEGAQEEAPAPKKQDVQIVRRGPSAQQPTKEKAKLTPQIELAIGGVGTFALLGIFWAAGLFPHISSSNASNPSQGSFTSGFLLASVVAAGVGYVGYSRLSKAMEFGGSYTNYPSHLHSPNIVYSTNRPAGVLIPQEYQKFPLIRKDELSADSYRLVFKLPSPTSVLGLPIGQHVAIRGFYDDNEGHHTVTRSYTPVSNNKDLGRLELVIKVYPDGQLTGKYLGKLQIGDQVEFRGPKGAMRYRKGMSKEIGMIAGGTGITPMYQLIRAICEDKTDDTTVSLLFANKTPEDILLRNQLDRLQAQAPKKFKITYFIDKALPGWTGEVGFITKKAIQEKLPAPSKDTKILLCGPPGMINASKKSLIDLGFEAPGAVSKLTDQIFLF